MNSIAAFLSSTGIFAQLSCGAATMKEKKKICHRTLYVLAQRNRTMYSICRVSQLLSSTFSVLGNSKGSSQAYLGGAASADLPFPSSTGSSSSASANKLVSSTPTQHPTPNTQQPTPNNQHPTTNKQQPTSNKQQQTTNNKQQTTNNKQQTTNNKQQTTNN
jgi:hypothetical protein